MGWLGRDRNGPDGFYTGDAPVSSPGQGNTEPSAYQSRPAGQTPQPPFQTPPNQPPHHQSPHHQPPPASQYQAQPWQPANAAPPPVFGAGYRPTTAAGSPPRRSNLVFPTVLGVVFLVGVSAFVISHLAGSGEQDESESPRTPPKVTSAPATPGRTTGVGPSTPTRPTGPAEPASPPVPKAVALGKPATVTYRDNTYRVTVKNAAWQQGLLWNSGSDQSKDGYLRLGVTLTRTDAEPNVNQISWSNWTFFPQSGPGSKEGVSAELSRESSSADLTTLALEPKQTVSGPLLFEVPAVPGVLQLRDTFDQVVGIWTIGEVSKVLPVKGAVGKPVRSPAGKLPFEITVGAPRWIASGSPELSLNPQNGYLLVVEFTVTSVVKNPSDRTDSVYPFNWRFTAKGEKPAYGGYGQINRDPVGDLDLTPGQTKDGTILLDTNGKAGTLSLVGRDDVPVISWPLPGP